jgi:hypothetical protein
LASDTTNGWGSAGYLFYFANIDNFSYQHKFKKIGAVLARVKSMEMSFSRTGYVTSGSYQVSLSASIEKIVTGK